MNIDKLHQLYSQVTEIEQTIAQKSKNPALFLSTTHLFKNNLTKALSDSDIILSKDTLSVMYEVICSITDNINVSFENEISPNKNIADAAADTLFIYLQQNVGRDNEYETLLYNTEKKIVALRHENAHPTNVDSNIAILNNAPCDATSAGAPLHVRDKNYTATMPYSIHIKGDAEMVDALFDGGSIPTWSPELQGELPQTTAVQAERAERELISLPAAILR